MAYEIGETAPISPVDIESGIYGMVDPRICPPEELLHWQSYMGASREVLKHINHVHGIVAGHIKGPEEVAIAIGISEVSQIGDTLDIYETLTESSREMDAMRMEATRRLSPIVLDYAFRYASNSIDDLSPRSEIDRLRFIGEPEKIVPTVLGAYSPEAQQEVAEQLFEDVLSDENGFPKADMAYHQKIVATEVTSSMLYELLLVLRNNINSKAVPLKPNFTIDVAGYEDPISARVWGVSPYFDAGSGRGRSMLHTDRRERTLGDNIPLKYVEMMGVEVPLDQVAVPSGQKA